jgi:predicted DNA-binding transcriptional regulator YafY
MPQRKDKVMDPFKLAAIRHPYIYAWCRMQGSFQYWIEDQLAIAERDQAPADAIYKSTTDGKWHTTRDIKNEETMALVQKIHDQYFNDPS